MKTNNEMYLMIIIALMLFGGKIFAQNNDRPLLITRFQHGSHK